MKRGRMVRITNTPGEYNESRLNPDSSSDIYTTTVKEDQYRIVVEKMRKHN